MQRQQQLLQRTTQQALHSQQAADVIELKDIQRLQELNVEDRYNVLEYLVKELIGIKKTTGKQLHHSTESEDVVPV